MSADSGSKSPTSQYPIIIFETGRIKRPKTNTEAMSNIAAGTGSGNVVRQNGPVLLVSLRTLVPGFCSETWGLCLSHLMWFMKKWLLNHNRHSETVREEATVARLHHHFCLFTVCFWPMCVSHLLCMHIRMCVCGRCVCVSCSCNSCRCSELNLVEVPRWRLCSTYYIYAFCSACLTCLGPHMFVYILKRWLLSHNSQFSYVVWHFNALQSWGKTNC